MWAYAIKLVKDSNATYLATVPDFPELATFGATQIAALEKAADAIEEAIAAHGRQGGRAAPIEESQAQRHALDPDGAESPAL